MWLLKIAIVITEHPFAKEKSLFTDGPPPRFSLIRRSQPEIMELQTLDYKQNV